jgi:hypothetical protein
MLSGLLSKALSETLKSERDRKISRKVGAERPLAQGKRDRGCANFLERRLGEVPRITLPRTPLNNKGKVLGLGLLQERLRRAHNSYVG